MIPPTFQCEGRLPNKELNSGTCLERQASTCAGMRESVGQPKMLRAPYGPVISETTSFLHR